MLKLLLLTVCCVTTIPVSLFAQFPAEKKLETALNDIEKVLQDIGKNEDTGSEQEYIGDFPRPILKSINRDMEEVLLHTTNVAKATAEIQAIGGKVKIQMGDNLLIAKVPADIATKQDAFAHSSPSIPSSAPKITRHNARAYEMYREDKRGPQPKVQKWTEKTAPKGILQQFTGKLPADSPYTYTLRGKIALAVIVASGPGSLAVSDAEYNQIYSEVLRGLDFWEDNAPADAGLSFVVYRGKATITAANGPAGCKNEGCHDVFAIPAYKKFGFSSKDHVAQWCKDNAGAVGAYVAFFSKYRQSHFAYAYFYGGPIYMQYSNDGWGPDQIDRVFAHETGHVFNAPDEYTSCNCYRYYGEGSCSAKNANCKQDGYQSCTSNQRSCIMDTNDLYNICNESRKHVGWC